MMPDPLSRLTPVQRQLLGQVVPHAGKLIGIGIVMVIAGFLGLLAEVAFSFASIAILAGVAFIAGILMGAHAFQARVWKTFVVQSLIAALYIALGVFVWVAPVTALEGLTLWLAALFLITGGIRVLNAFQNAAVVSPLWGVVSGLLSIVLGGLILANWPAASLWIPGMLLAIELLLQGWVLILVGVAMKKMDASKLN
jgi:uncharacterized membrane protein HdeD (DUF308 family)